MKEDHATAIARHVLRELEQQPPRLVRRLIIPQLRWLAEDPDEERARQAGVLGLVERARDEHLARLDADDGLAVLTVSWVAVVGEAAILVEPAAAHRCTRCGARLSQRRRVCARCRQPAPR
jgi:hypothetical protein